MTFRRFGALIAVLAGLASCAGSAAPADDPLADIQNPKLSVTRRIVAINAAWSSSQGASRLEARETLKSVAWSSSAPIELRLAALDKLMNDPEGQPEARASAARMIPLEGNLEVVGFVGDAAVAHGWTELTPALIRSYAQASARPDPDRPERRALLALNPGKSIVEIAFDEFLAASPAAGGTPPASDAPTIAKVRLAAWDLLARLDADGTAREALIASASPGPSGAAPVLDDLRACREDLRTMPISSGELDWLQSLRDPAHAADAAWWSEATAAVEGLSAEQASGLRLRHIEAVRWARQNRPDWAGADRLALMAQAVERLKGREIHRRQARGDLAERPPTERLPDVQDRLVWGDALCILVLDEAIQNPALRAQLFEQAAADRKDETTEYGGLLFLPPRGYRAASYPPRPSERMGDAQFVASPDMIAQGDLAAAHYHFHVSRDFNSEFSGPSGGDLAYAAHFGRNCIVLTSITTDVLSADYYQPGGITIDFGEIRPR